jgi:two-component system, cell cycle response regulator
MVVIPRPGTAESAPARFTGLRSSAPEPARQRIGDVLADPVCRATAAGVIVWLIGYALATGLSQGHPAWNLFIGDLLYLVPIAGSVVTAVIAAIRSTGRHRRMWQLLAAAFGAQLVGESVWAAYDYLTANGPPQPSLADVFYLTASTLTVVAVLTGFGGAGGLRQLRGLMDSALIVVSLGALSWQMLIQPQLGGEPTWADAVNACYPLLDVVLLSSVVIVGMGGHRSVPLAVRLVGVVGTINAVSDMVYTCIFIFGHYDSGSWVDVCFEAGASCALFAGVVAARRPEPPAERRSFDRGLTLLPILVSTAATVALVIFDKTRTGTVGNVTLGIAGFLVLAVLVRQYLFTADRAQLALQLRQAVVEQQRLAVTDGLTGLYNRRHLTDVLRDSRTGGRAERPISLIVVDLDHFKNVNDTYGHPTGDVVLQETAARISRAARTGDVVARYGGEEFVILLADTAGPEAWTIAERVHRIVGDGAIRAGDAQIVVTASVGVATSDRGDTVDELMENADRALYQAKAQGRDRVMVLPAAVASRSVTHNARD